MSRDQPYRGFVAGILSGDSLIVRFVSSQIAAVQIVCLEHLIAPKYGSTDGTIHDEPHAFESWNFLRNLCIGQRVLVAPPTNKPDLSRSHPAFGRMPVFFSRVSLCSRSNDDVGLICVEAGWVHIRSPRIRDKYVNSLFAGEDAAKRQKIGIWRPNGFIRSLPVKYDPLDLVDQGEFDAIVESVINGTTVALFLLPRHEHIIFQIAACRSPSAKRDNGAEFGPEARDYTIRSLLHRQTRVRLCNVNDVGLFLGPILDRTDRCIRGLIAEGLARFNPATADLAPSAIEYERCEAEAKATRRHIWADEEVFNTSIQTFDGEVRRILGTTALEVDVLGETRIVQFNCIKIPPFIPGGGSEPLSFEARERLRNLLIGKVVTCIVDGAIEGRFFCTVYAPGGVCVNELMCREGYGKICDPIIGRESEKIDAMRKGENDAKNAKIGVHSPKMPAILQLTDYSLNIVKEVALQHINEFRMKELHGIVEDVLGGNRFAILVPEQHLMLRCAVNGLLPLSPSDRLGREAMSFCAHNYLNRNINFVVVDVDRSGGFIANMAIITPGNEIEDIAAALLTEGLAELHHRTASSMPNFDELYEIQERAKREGVGKWADKTRFEVNLEYNKFYAVRVLNVWSATELVVQFLTSTMQEIDNTLASVNQPIKHQLMKNDLVVAQYDNNRYRARIEKAEDPQTIFVCLVDVDMHVEVTMNNLFELPPKLDEIEPQALTVQLAYLDLVSRRQEDIQRVIELTANNLLFLHLMYYTEKPAVLLLDRQSINGNSLNAMVLYNAEVRLTDIDIDVGDEYNQLIANLKKIDAAVHPSSDIED